MHISCFICLPRGLAPTYVIGKNSSQPERQKQVLCCLSPQVLYSPQSSDASLLSDHTAPLMTIHHFLHLEDVNFIVVTQICEAVRK